MADYEEHLKQERLKFFVRLTERCVDVLAELDMKDLSQRYQSSENSGLLDYYAFTYLSDRTLFLEVAAKFHQLQIENIGTHRFISHQSFESKLEKYTRTNKKPNLILEKTRPWDVAANLVMKVEAVERNFVSYHHRLLKREHIIMEHLWRGYMKENMDFDDMTGIPMVFDYDEVKNQKFVLFPGTNVEEIDVYGRLCHRNLNFTESTLSYMTMEKLGPSLSYTVELMGVARRQTFGLTISSAFKIFDQLICRLLQIHRLSVIHNGICPQNIYFGRSMCFNVVYLNNFRAATLASSQPGIKPVINMRVAKDVRFASLSMMKSTDMHPVDDIESAFYTLLACIGSGLPWDSLLQAKANEPSESESSSGPAPPSQPKANTSGRCTAPTGQSRQIYSAIRSAKVAFWNSKNYLERFIASLLHRLSERESGLFNLIAGILQDLYAKVKRILSVYAGSKNSVEYCAQLCRGGSLVLLYNELRKPGLMFFNFEVVPPLLRNLASQNRQEALSHGITHLMVAWNLSEWCFNSVEIRAPWRPARMSKLLSEIVK